MAGPVFIVGLSRSGTTLLSMILNAHSLLSISPESHYFTHFCSKRKCIKETQDIIKAQKIVEKFLNSIEIGDFGFSQQEKFEILDFLLSCKNLTHGLILETVLARYASKNSKPFYGEKTPRHLKYIPIILDLFEDAMFIAIIRDPRDVSLSLQKVSWSWGGILVHSLKWRQYYSVWKRHANIYPSRFLEIKYEDLLRETPSVVRKIYAFLKLPYEPTHLKFFENYNATFKPHKEPWKAKSLTPLDPQNIMKWVDQMKPEEIKVSEIVCKNIMLSKGYQLKSEPMSMILLIKVFRVICKDILSIIRYVYMKFRSSTIMAK